MMNAGAQMKKMRLPLIFGAAIFVATLVASAPASLISVFISSQPGGVAYRDARGTIWNGELVGASIAGAPLGNVAFRLSPASLLQLAPDVALSARGGAVIGSGRMKAGAGGQIELRDVDAQIALGAIAPQGIFGEPVNGDANVAIERVVFSRRAGCRQARGEITTNVLDAPAKRFNLPALPMAGTIACDGEVLVVSLAGENPRAGADFTMRLNKAMTYEIIATARPVEESVASALRVFGFEDDNGALTYGSAGVLTGAGS